MAATSFASWVYPLKLVGGSDESSWVGHLPSSHATHSIDVCTHTRLMPSMHVCTHVAAADTCEHDALEMFEQAHPCEEALAPCVLVDLLHSCKDVASAYNAHSLIVQSGYDVDTYVGTNLVQLFTRLNNLSEACRMFEKVKEPNVITWTSVISAHSKLGHEKQGIEFYHKMCKWGIDPDGSAVVCVLDACSKIAAIEEGMQIHEHVVKSGLESNVYVGNALVTMYACCGDLKHASTTFARAPVRDVITWTALMGGYIQQGYEQAVFELLKEMQQEGMEPNLFTCVHLLEACSSIDIVFKYGMLAHGYIIENAFDQDELVGSVLINMYAKSGLLQDAHGVFDELSRRDVVAWTSLITGYTTQEDEEHAHISLQLYEQMQAGGIEPNIVAYVSILKACAIVAALEYGRKVHQKIVKAGLEGDVQVSGSIIDMYVKCRRLEEALCLFGKLSVRNVVVWSSLIMGHVELDQGDTALELAWQMQQEDVEPDMVCFICILKACTSVAALEQGMCLHGNAVKRGFETDEHLGSTLIYMYSNCGSIDNAEAVFERLQSRNVVIYNALITGYAQNNNFVLAYKSLEHMQRDSHRPNDVTFLSLLVACSNLSLVKEGCYIFTLMRDGHAMLPAREHCNTMVDVLGHAGLLHECEDLLETMPFKTNVVGWVSLLSSCRTYGNIGVGRRSFRMVVSMEPLLSSGYVLMSDLYSRIGLHKRAERMEQLRLSLNAWKVPGRSYIEIEGRIHMFVVGNDAHPRIRDIYAKLEEIITSMRQGPPKPLAAESGEHLRGDLCGHSEKLAVGLGLISTSRGKTLRISKNLCMCADCHSVMMFISQSEGRKIVVIDSFCVHEFKDGQCTCTNHLYKSLYSTTSVKHV